MMRKLLEFLKPLVMVAVIFFLLQATGLWGDVSYFAQSAVIETGLLDAHADSAALTDEPFDYNFTIKDLDGKKVSFNDYKGKVVFLNMWATWCGPCRSEMPTIEKLYSEVNKEKIAFVILSIDRDSDKEKVVNYVKNKHFTFPVFQPSGILTEQLNIPSIPTTFVISKDGKIATMEVGTTNFNTPKFKKFLTDLAAK